MNQLDLVVPGLCGPLPDLQGLEEGSNLASLARLLSRGDCHATSARNFHSQLANLFMMDESVAMPSASLSLLGYGDSPVDACWLHADPVHLQADMDHAILRDSESLDISSADADALAKEINTYFKDDNIYLHVASRNQWFLNIGNQVDIVTTPLHDVIGRNVNFFLPRGRDEKFAKRLMNEMQMLLHASNVNREREQLGKLPINSIWLWGEGALPESSSSGIQDVYSNHQMVKGLAEVHGARHHPVGEAGSLIAGIVEKDHALVVIDELFGVSCYGDVVAWQEKLETFFESWLEPVVSHMLNNKVQINLYPCNGVYYKIVSGNRYRFWRKGNMKDYVTVDE